jgi:hypothetical protein
VIWLPGDDKLPWGIVVGSGAMLGVSLFIQTSLGFFPWIVGAVLIFGGILALQEFPQSQGRQDHRKSGSS